MTAQFAQAVKGLSSGPTRHQSLLSLIRFHGTLGLVLQQLLSLSLYVLAEWECPPRQPFTGTPQDMMRPFYSALYLFSEQYAKD